MMFSLSSKLFLALLWFITWRQKTARAEETWRFLVVADWHGAEPFVQYPVWDVNNFPPLSGARKKINTFTHIHDNYGGELVVLPGDAESGKWYREEFLDLLNANTPQQAVIKAGKRCYASLKNVFEAAGYSKLIMAVGDHELGGNNWLNGLLKTNLLPQYRTIFYKQFNRDSQGNFLYPDPIGTASSRPLGTLYATTSYAYRYKNVLFVTVDAFKQLADDFHDKSRGVGGEGTVTCDVSGAHLNWFRNVLDQARRDSTIKHIFVQTHLPAIQPVRKIRCTGQFMDYAEWSPFFQAMRDYNVDVYFAGDVHSNTVTKDYQSNVLQVVSRGNGAQNFIIVSVTDDAIKLTQYNEIGPKPQHNANYEFYGRVTIDKSGGATTFQSTGSLKLLNRQQPMIYFPFDEMFLLSERQVLGLDHDDEDETLFQRKTTILGTECWNSFPNMGAFDQPYDAQVGHVVLQPGIRGKAARFNSTSRVAVWGLGPHNGGIKISYALWFKTADSQRNQIVLNLGSVFFVSDRYRNLFFSLTLDSGVPALYAPSADTNMTLVPSDGSMNLANDEWHHMAISMPRNSCRLSEVHMYVDGQRVSTRVKGVDDFLFITTAGSIGVGGFGYTKTAVRQRLMPGHEPYAGLIDEVYVFANSLSSEEVATLSERSSQVTFTTHNNYRCRGDEFTKHRLAPNPCKEKCLLSNSCLGYDVKMKDSGTYICRQFKVNPPTRAWQKQGSICAIKN